MGFGFVVARFGLFLHEIAAVRETVPAKASTGTLPRYRHRFDPVGRRGDVPVSAEHVRLMRKVRAEPPYGVRSWLMGVVVAWVLAILGIAMAVYLVFAAR